MSWLFDFDDGDFAMPVSDDMAMDMDGDLMMKLSDDMAMDLESGEIHIVSGWTETDDE